MLRHCAALLLLCRVAADDALPPYPDLRFTPWDDLESATRSSARHGGYHEKFWNKPGTLEAETRAYADLHTKTRDFLEGVGLAEEQWDCWVNHYRGYAWDDLGAGARAGYAALGWTADAWETGEEPEAEGKYWEDLTDAQREAAAGVCYAQPIWDDVAIPLWTEDDGAGGEVDVGEADADAADAVDLLSPEESAVVEEKQEIYERIYDGGDLDAATFEGPASAHNDGGVAVPFFRYDPWDLLDPELQLIAEQADYDEKSWNTLGSNPLEHKDWYTIGEDTPDVQKALGELGFTEEKWDCYMLHYRTYAWRELAEVGVQQHFVDLGYTHAMWGEDEDPEVFGMYWPDLTEAQREAAYQVGYFREVWDAVSLQFWPRTTANSAPLEEYVATLPIYPIVRFTPWDDLPDDVRVAARAVGYHGKTWNKLGKLEAERLSYPSLEPEMREFLDSIPISAESWDCYVNHYLYCEWDDLGADARASYVALGWTGDTWGGDEKPEAEGWYWKDLTDAQREAATSVCYTQEVWDEVAIPLWDRDDGEGGVEGEEDAEDLYSVEETKVVEEKQDIYEQMYGDDEKSMVFDGPASARNDRGIVVPFFRYDPWDLLDPSLREIAGAADYDEKSWNAIGSNELERMDWEMIGKKHHTMQKVLKQMGFTEEQWDCYILHYRTYDWRELEEAGVQRYFEDLGYNYETWEHEDKPDSFSKYWPDLTEAQRDAAYQVGYFRETWDEVSLQFWPRTTANSIDLKEYVKQHKAAVGGGTSAVLIGLIIACVCGYRVMAKEKHKTARRAKEVEMYGGDRFTDYSDEPTRTDVLQIASSGSSEDDGYDGDCPNEAKPIV